MKAVYRGLGVTVLQCILVLTVSGKYAFDRARLPRAWAKVAPVDPNLPVRGRYLRLRVEVNPPSFAEQYMAVRLTVADNRLSARQDSAGTVHITGGRNTADWTLVEPVAFYLPEHAKDPSRLAAGEELWVEVSVPAKGDPRPIRLGIRQNGVLQPLDLR